MHEVLHLIDDSRAGGVMTNLKKLVDTSAALPGIHQIEEVNSANPMRAFKHPAKTIVVHFSLAWRKLPFLFVLRRLNSNARIILQEHHYCAEHFFDTTTNQSRFESLMRCTAPLFDQIIAVSDIQAKWLGSMGVAVNAVISPLVELTELLQLPHRTAGDRLVVGVSGRFCKAKGFDVVLAALELPGARQLDFLLAGYGEYEESIAAAARRYQNVEYIGAYADPKGYLAGCDVVLVPSRQETFGLNCLEAKAAAKPVVVTRCSGLLSQAFACGVIVEPNDPQALLHGLSELKPNESLIKFGQIARKQAARHKPIMLDQWRQALTQEQIA